MERLICFNSWTISTKLRLCDAAIHSSFEGKGTEVLLEQLLYLYYSLCKGNCNAQCPLIRYPRHISRAVSKETNKGEWKEKRNNKRKDRIYAEINMIKKESIIRLQPPLWSSGHSSWLLNGDVL
jgi:hypothetical protein